MSARGWGGRGVAGEARGRGPFPLARNAGLFTLTMGLAVLAALPGGTALHPLHGAAILAGFALGGAAAFGPWRRRLAAGPGTRRR